MKKTPSSLESADEILSLLKRNVHERETEGEANISVLRKGNKSVWAYHHKPIFLT
jgi:hypothetical protein